MKINAYPCHRFTMAILHEYMYEPKARKQNTPTPVPLIVVPVSYECAILERNSFIVIYLP